MSNIKVNKGSFDSNSSHGWKHIGQSERLVSMVAGTTLASSAMRSRSLMSAAILLGISAGLLHRGATGRCGFAKSMEKLNVMLNDVGSKVAEKTGNFGSSNQGGNQSGSQRNRSQNQVDEASDESFPASDSPSFTPVTGESEDRSKLHMNK